MKPIGKTYLIKAKPHDASMDMQNGIYIPDTSSVHDVYYQGKIVAYGSGWTQEQLKDLLPLETNVIFNYKQKKGTKIIFGENVYYIHAADQILAIMEEED